MNFACLSKLLVLLVLGARGVRPTSVFLDLTNILAVLRWVFLAWLLDMYLYFVPACCTCISFFSFSLLFFISIQGYAVRGVSGVVESGTCGMGNGLHLIRSQGLMSLLSGIFVF